MDYQQKYLKYKRKYLDLKKLIAGDTSGKLFILIGSPGSGKSTIASTLTTPENICEADKFPNLYDKDGVIDFNKLPLAHEECRKCVKSKMMSNTRVIVQSNTNLDLGDKGIKPYIQLAKEYNYDVQFILPKNDLLHFELQEEIGKTTAEKRAIQIVHLTKSRSVESKGKEGFKLITDAEINRMVSDFDRLKPELNELQKYNDPSVILSKLPV